MTLRLNDEETEQLRRFAAKHGRSMQDIAREAIRTMTIEPQRRELPVLDFGRPIAHDIDRALEGFGE